MIVSLIQIQALFSKKFQEIDVKAGGGHKMTMGEVLRQWMVKLEWYSTLFPRIDQNVTRIFLTFPSEQDSF